MTNSGYYQEYQKQRYHERIELAHKLLGNKCAKCNETSNLEIDHIDPKIKEKDFTYYTRLSIEKFVEEVNKCQLLCKFHHNEKTVESRSVGHGEGLSGKRNCKCDLCRAKKNEYMKNYHRSRGFRNR